MTDSAMRKLLAAIVFAVLLALGLWASDRITMQGERTIFTVNCDNGSWQGDRCNGKLVADGASPLGRSGTDASTQGDGAAGAPSGGSGGDGGTASGGSGVLLGTVVEPEAPRAVSIRAAFRI